MVYLHHTGHSGVLKTQTRAQWCINTPNPDTVVVTSPTRVQWWLCHQPGYRGGYVTSPGTVVVYVPQLGTVAVYGPQLGTVVWFLLPGTVVVFPPTRYSVVVFL